MTCPEAGDKPEKSGLIPRKLPPMRRGMERLPLRWLPLWEGLAAYQVVGGVKAYQADDGYPV